MIRNIAVLGALTLVAACNPDDPSVTREYPVVTEDAGVRTVLNAPLDSAPRCVLSNSPEVTIGNLVGGDGHDLYRVYGASVLADGRIVVVDQGSQQLRFFSPSGELLGTSGREGEGPGEFVGAFLLFKLPGDTLWVGDYRPWSFEVFDAQGDWLRNVPLSPTFMNSPEAGAVLDDGRTLFAERVLPGPRDFEPRQIRVMLYDRTGQVTDTIGVFDSGRSGQTVDDPQSLHMAPWFEPQFEMAVGGARVALGHGATPEVRVFTVSSSDLDPALVLRWEDEDRTVSRADVEAAREEVRLRNPDMDPGARARFVDPLVSPERPASDVLPTFSSISFGDDGAIWVRRYRRPDIEEEVAEWIRFTSDGVVECRLQLPSEATIQEFGADHVLLLQRDDLRAESLVLYRWSRVDAQPPSRTPVPRTSSFGPRIVKETARPS